MQIRVILAILPIYDASHAATPPIKVTPELIAEYYPPGKVEEVNKPASGRMIYQLFSSSSRSEKKKAEEKKAEEKKAVEVYCKEHVQVCNDTDMIQKLSLSLLRARFHLQEAKEAKEAKEATVTQLELAKAFKSSAEAVGIVKTVQTEVQKFDGLRAIANAAANEAAKGVAQKAAVRAYEAAVWAANALNDTRRTGNSAYAIEFAARAQAAAEKAEAAAEIAIGDKDEGNKALEYAIQARRSAQRAIQRAYQLRL